QAVLQLLTGAYAEHARTRGLVLKQTIALPPFEQPGTPSQLILIWEYPSLNALWQARAAESDTALAELWQQIDAMSLRRTRRLGRPEPMAGCERAPEEPAPIDEADNAQRWILFVQPVAALDSAARAQWVTAAQALPGALRSQAGFHQDYSFLPDQMTWEVTLPAAVGPAELLTALPGAAQLTDAVELGVTLGSGVRDALLSGTKRTILLGADSALSGERLALLEHVLAETPHYITALRNWRLSRVARSHGTTAWTHCIEQEVFDANVFLTDYLNHPFHWAVVDRFFHTEAPELSAHAFLHTLYPIERSALAEPLRS